MNDIAVASKKGRRTLYTYFKSKDEIYLAVVESELDILSDVMKRVAEKNISPDSNVEKNREMLLQRSIAGLAKYGELFASGYFET